MPDETVETATTRLAYASGAQNPYAVTALVSKADLRLILDALAARTAERDEARRQCAVAEFDADRLREYLRNLGMEMPELL